MSVTTSATEGGHGGRKKPLYLIERHYQERFDAAGNEVGDILLMTLRLIQVHIITCRA
jgi:hypothetical protein|tara:strand:- start:335 stop:508 length:174 start_codon:yes stop_codon:yes gene_type:complete